MPGCNTKDGDHERQEEAGAAHGAPAFDQYEGDREEREPIEDESEEDRLEGRRGPGAQIRA